MSDPYADNSPTPSSFGTRGAPVTPSNTNDLGTVAKAIVVTAAGNLTIIPAGNAADVSIPFTACPVGYMPPYRVRRVMATGTTATVATVDD